MEFEYNYRETVNDHFEEASIVPLGSLGRKAEKRLNRFYVIDKIKIDPVGSPKIAFEITGSLVSSPYMISTEVFHIDLSKLDTHVLATYASLSSIMTAISVFRCR